MIAKAILSHLKKKAMKNLNPSFPINLLSLLALILIFSSFTYMTHTETQQSLWAVVQDYSFHKLSFWQRTVLTLGASGAGYALVRKHYRRHYDDGGWGCLGVLGALILGILIIALLPVILVVALVMLICGIPFPRFWGRYHRDRHHHRRR
jgi:Flp pilus assembly protein TadB